MLVFWGVLFVPMLVEAGFFSALLGDEASAEVKPVMPIPTPIINSQNIALLQANVSSVLVLQDKDNKDNSKVNTINDPSADANIIDNALMSGISDRKDLLDSSSEDSSVYRVKEGDSISQIAEMFDVSVNTILAANDLKKGDKLKKDDVLLIPPISGIEHTVKKGQTLQSIAKLYKVDVSDIAGYNGIAIDAKLTINDELMIPGGEMIDEGGDKPASNLGSAAAKDKNYYATHSLQNLIGYFINPLRGVGRKTQGLHGPGNRGIDIGAPKGTPIYAAASGTVLIAKTGWSGGYGNMAIVQHPNGTKTLYAHMSKLGTKTGAQVSQGEIIGYVGSTGHSTGPHLHFEVFNARNPGTDWSWAN